MKCFSAGGGQSVCHGNCLGPTRRREGDGASPADAGQRRHPTLQQSLGIASSNGEKKDGSLRFCVDFRQLNAVTVKDTHPLPRIDDLLDALHGARWFSTLDLKSGYWQVPIMERDKKTAFRTSSGQLYEFNQVLFGLCNAPATFSRLMDHVLSGHHWETCLFYLDDIIVFSSTWETHLARLRQVFERLRHANLKLGAEKCAFAAKVVSYLGHRVTEQVLLPDPALLAAIREILPLKTTTEVRSFLGLAGYYRRYVKNFAAITSPLRALTRKDAVFIGALTARMPSTT